MLVKDYVPIAMGTLPAATQSSWKPYAREIVDRFGEQDMTAVVHSQLKTAAAEIQKRVAAQKKRKTNWAAGAGARTSFIQCARAIWACGIADKICESNPAASLEIGKKHRAHNRRALTNDELARTQFALANTNDPDLALLVFRIFLETGARRGELLGLSTQSLIHSDQGWSLVLDTGAKNRSMRVQPITDRLAEAIQVMALDRVGEDWRQDTTPLLRSKRGIPITRRFLENRAAAVRKADPDLGGAELAFTWHLLRHTAGTLVERVAGFATAAYFLGHSINSGSATAVTLTYTGASPEEVRRAVEAIWEPEKAAARKTRAKRQAVMQDLLESIEPEDEAMPR